MQNAMHHLSDAEITTIIKAWSMGDSQALHDLIPKIYEALHRITASHLRRERGLTLQTTDVLHEAFIRMQGAKMWGFENRNQFLGFASTIIRRVLVDHARAKGAQKRISEPISLDEFQLSSDLPNQDLLHLNEILQTLMDIDPKKGKLADMFIFAGLTLEEISIVLEQSLSSTKRQWRFTKQWLSKEMKKN